MGYEKLSNGTWMAFDSDCSGYGKTKAEAKANALKERRGNAEDSDRMDAEEGKVRDEFGFVVRDADGPWYPEEEDKDA